MSKWIALLIGSVATLAICFQNADSVSWLFHRSPESMQASAEGHPSRVVSAKAVSTFFRWARERLKTEDVEAVTLFVGGDGQHQRDVVLVVSMVKRTVVGVYQTRYGR